jgi:hypothetical protein
MLIPSIHLDIARERQQHLIARSERHRLAQELRRAPQVRFVARFEALAPFLKVLAARSSATSSTPGKSDAQEVTTMANGITTRTPFRELAHRATNGLEVSLVWSELENRLSVRVSDTRAGQRFVLHVENDNALDVFYHPYAHAAWQAVVEPQPLAQPEPVSLPRLDEAA